MYRVIRYVQRQELCTQKPKFSNTVKMRLDFVQKQRTIPLVHWIFEHEIHEQTCDIMEIDRCLDIIKYIKVEVRRMTFRQYQRRIQQLDKMILIMSKLCLRKKVALRHFRMFQTFQSVERKAFENCIEYRCKYYIKYNRSLVIYVIYYCIFYCYCYQK